MQHPLAHVVPGMIKRRRWFDFPRIENEKLPCGCYTVADGVPGTRQPVGYGSGYGTTVPNPLSPFAPYSRASGERRGSASKGPVMASLEKSRNLLQKGVGIEPLFMLRCDRGSGYADLVSTVTSW